MPQTDVPSPESMTRSSMVPRTTLTDLPASALADYTAAVSLHAHTDRSSEVMSGVAGYFDRIPIVGLRIRKELRAYERRNRTPIDFTKVWWHPPLDPRQVLDSERAQIAGLGLRPFVSITDHDTIDGPLDLQRDRLDPPV